MSKFNILIHVTNIVHVTKANIHLFYKLVILSLLTLILTEIKATSQQLDDAICGSGGKLEMDYRKKPWKGNNLFLQKYLEQINYFNETDKVRYLVPLKFWVYRDNNGQGGASLKEIRQFMIDLNQINSSNQTGIQFYIREIKYIDKTARQVFGYYLEAPLQTILRHTKPALNVYLVEKFKKKQESRRMVKGTYNIVTKSVIIQRNNSNTALTHEIGHYFGLLHPHRHYNFGKSRQEPVSRTRKVKDDASSAPLCELNGDLLSDTPAEPKLTFLVDNNCNFTGTALKDAWGDNYCSVVNNIMSYPTHFKCRNAFTLSQKSVMLYSASINKYAKYWNTENAANHKYFYDRNEPDNDMEMADTLELDVEQAHNFHKIFLKPGKDISDTSDWIKFEVKRDDKRNIKITIQPDKDNQELINAQLLDKNLIRLSSNSTNSSNENIELGFKNVVSDWYYIHVSVPGNNKTEKIDKYTVSYELY